MEISALPHNFIFTQQSLTTFENCPLKFKKRYMDRIKWSSAAGQNTKMGIELGRSFHLLARRYFMGIETPPESLAEYPRELRLWMDSLVRNFKIDPAAEYFPEYKLRASLGVVNLEANFDLLIAKDQSLQIWDWKTHDTETFAKQYRGIEHFIYSLQTKVYLFVLREQSRCVLGKDTGAEVLSMYYWQPDPAQTLAEINYSASQHMKFREELEKRIQTILNYDYSIFDKSLYSKHCKYCEFNWLCNNSRVGFDILEPEEGLNTSL